MHKRVVTTALVALVVAAGLGSALAYRHATSVKGDLPTRTSARQLDTAAQERQSENTRRDNDALQLLAAANEYMSNNNGKLPTAWKGNGLTDDAGAAVMPIEFTYYPAATVVRAPQLAVHSDKLVLVIGGACGDNGAVVAANLRSMTVQYMRDETGNGFTPTCKSN